MTAAAIRTAYLKFFESKGHTLVKSSPVVPQDDPTLLFTNAGMNQFKANFLGLDKSLHRASTAQKCIRAGGKHNDLDNVGYTARHHTFFEMLGNFSFGDYFKREAIGWAWELLTTVYKLPEERLWVTVYAEDDEAYDIWAKEIGVPVERIVRIGDNKGARYMSDNFWMMGDTGPCGPCSEIFYDRGPSVQGGPPGSPDEDGDRYMEIWNLVFTQFNRDASGKMNRLPNPNIDTGMGLERLASVLQGVPTNYDIDLFQNLMFAAASAIRAAGAPDVDMASPSLKVVADHIRSCAFSIADGVAPGNEGRAYVLRRICRRAIRHGYKLGARDLFFYKLVKPLADEMGSVYPELKNPRIAEVIKAEEQRFMLTLAKGMEILEAAIAESKDGVLDGSVAFKLHDTYGFPVDLTGDVCREKGLAVDVEAFNACMQEQRSKARAAAKFKIAAGLVYTGEGNEFEGYDKLRVMDARVLAIYKGGTEVESADAGDDAVVVLDKTAFYAEMGGQVGDTGYIGNATTAAAVLDTFKIKANVFGHSVHVTEGCVRKGDAMVAAVDPERRAAIARNHSVTHMMHKALREVLGAHVAQKGSLVNADLTRFDFVHGEAMTPGQIRAVEDLVNKEILANTPARCEVMGIEDAKNSGAVMLFGEKYGKEVRVVTIGSSCELCGGTHVKATGDIGAFKVLGEAGISAGVRRIEAVTGLNALRLMQHQAALLADSASRFKVPAEELPGKIDHLAAQVKSLEKELADFKAKLAARQSSDLLRRAEEINGVKVLIGILEGADPKVLRDTVDKVKSKFGTCVVLLGAPAGDKLQLCAGVTPDLHGKVKAGDLVRWAAMLMGGKGGGKPDMAMGSASGVQAFKQNRDAVVKNLTEALR
ncbi:MAG: alanine--tRNA ligase [Duodenibacillus sp.]|nr:alanine--tRNA ligase [Duodenibacillus sp.]